MIIAATGEFSEAPGSSCRTTADLLFERNCLQSTEITMTQITQICPQCGDSFVLDARYCTHCGHDTALPAGQKLLPTLLGQAALPMLVGAASLAVSAGWQLLRHLLSRPASPPLASAPPAPAPRSVSAPPGSSEMPAATGAKAIPTRRSRSTDSAHRPAAPHSSGIGSPITGGGTRQRMSKSAAAIAGISRVSDQAIERG